MSTSNITNSPGVTSRPQQIRTDHDADVTRRHLVYIPIFRQLRQKLYQVPDVRKTQTHKAAFTPDMSPGYKLYPLASLVTVYVYPVSATKLSSRRHVFTCIRIQVARPRYWLHVSGVNKT